MEQILNFAKNFSHEEIVNFVKILVPEEQVQFSARPDVGIKLDFGDVGFWVYKELKYHDRYGSFSPLDAVSFADSLPEINGQKWHIISMLQGGLLNSIRHQFNEFARVNGFSEVVRSNFVLREKAMAASPFQMQTYIFTARI